MHCNLHEPTILRESDSFPDQGTGSTYAALGPYWAEKLGKTQLVAVQPSARGAKARLDCSDAEKVVVYAKAMKVAEGQMLVP